MLSVCLTTSWPATSVLLLNVSEQWRSLHSPAGAAAGAPGEGDPGHLALPAADAAAAGGRQVAAARAARVGRRAAGAHHPGEVGSGAVGILPAGARFRRIPESAVSRTRVASGQLQMRLPVGALQEGEHSPVDDARAALYLYHKHRKVRPGPGCVQCTAHCSSPSAPPSWSAAPMHLDEGYRQSCCCLATAFCGALRRCGRGSCSSTAA
jgi:hypothetical protein